MGAVKFNVDDSLLGKPGPAGVDGVLHDHIGTELIKFSYNIGIADSNEAEVITTKEALFFFLEISVGYGSNIDC
ncbi:hypothetical protein PTKIN_Ptkin16aG0023000 [Pterospermum kingtungense]